MAKTHLPHPGEMLRNEFLDPMGISVYRAARDMRMTNARLNEIVLGKRSITADTAHRLSRYLGTSAQMWMNMQANYDLAIAGQSPVLQTITPRVPAA